MRPDAWLFTCQLAACGTRHRRAYGDAETFRVEGDKAAAIKSARARGWTPCSDFNNDPGRPRSRSLASWYCPGCAAYVRGLYSPTKPAAKNVQL